VTSLTFLRFLKPRLETPHVVACFINVLLAPVHAVFDLPAVKPSWPAPLPLKVQQALENYQRLLRIKPQ